MAKRIKRRQPARIYSHPRETLIEQCAKQIEDTEARLAIAPTTPKRRIPHPVRLPALTMAVD